MSEVHNWLKNLPGGLHLERCRQQFESRGFCTLGSLKYLRPGDINDAFFPSPEKLLLAEKRILESEIKAIVDTESKRTPLRPVELSQQFQQYRGLLWRFFLSFTDSLESVLSGEHFTGNNSCSQHGHQAFNCWQ